MEETRPSLLERVRDSGANCAWEEFYQRYWEPILRYACKMGLSEPDANDVLQETMIALMRILPTFEYRPEKGKFRNFLLTIVHRKVLAALRRAARAGEISLDETTDGDGVALRDRLPSEGATTFETEDVHRWQQCLVERALRVIREDPGIDANTFGVFTAYVIDDRPCADVAEEFGENPNNVYQIKNRLLRRLRQEVQALAHG